MEANKILQSDFLDLLFEGKNKLYGAYEMRRFYTRRLTKAILFTCLFISIAVVGTVVAGKSGKEVGGVVFVETHPGVIPPDPPQAITPPPPPPPPKTEIATPAKAPAARQITFTRPEVVEDFLAQKVSTLPEDAAIGSQTILVGNAQPIVQAPIADVGTTFEKPSSEKASPEPFVKVEKEAEFPGGAAAWKRYLERKLNPSVAIDNGAGEGSYTVQIQFVVSIDGTISRVKALTHLGFGMEEEAIKIITNGPKWIPALQNGTFVNAYRKQSITFVVAEN